MQRAVPMSSASVWPLIPDADCTVPTRAVLAIENSLNMYPNPTSGLLHIVFENEKTQPVVISVADVMGRVLLSQNSQPASFSFYETLDLSGLGSGVYFVRVQMEDGFCGEEGCEGVMRFFKIET